MPYAAKTAGALFTAKKLKKIAKKA